MVNMSKFYSYLRSLSEAQYETLMEFCNSDTKIFFNMIMDGDFNGLTFEKDKFENEIDAILNYTKRINLPYSKSDVYITYLNMFLRKNLGLYSMDLDLRHGMSNNFDIVNVILCYPDDKLDTLYFDKADRFFDALMLLIISQTENINKPNKEIFKRFIKKRILSNSSSYDLRRFDKLLQMNFIDKKYFLDTLVETCNDCNAFNELFDNTEIYNGFSIDPDIQEYLLDLLINSGRFTDDFIKDHLYQIYRYKEMSEFIDEVLPYDINYIKVLYEIVEKGNVTKRLKQLVYLAYQTHPDDVEKCDIYDYTLPLRQLFILIKSCLNRKITHEDSRLLTRSLCGLLCLHDYNFEKIVNSLYSNSKAIF